MGGCMSFFSKCCDRDGDGKTTAKEVFENVGEALGMLNKVAETAGKYVKALEAAGVDTKGALDILTRINIVLGVSEDAAKAVAKIKIPTKLSEIGDVNGDGNFDKADVIAYMTAAQEVCNALIAAGVKPGEVQKYRDDLAKVIEVVKAVDAEPAPAALVA